MGKTSSRRVSLTDYIAAILKNAVYERGEQLAVIVPEVPDLLGEQSRENRRLRP